MAPIALATKHNAFCSSLLYPSIPIYLVSSIFYIALTLVYSSIFSSLYSSQVCVNYMLLDIK
jgi:hypothetical protein